jgi:hypothetical protein
VPPLTAERKHLGRTRRAVQQRAPHVALCASAQPRSLSSVANDQRIERDEQVRCLSLAQPKQRRRVGDRVGQRCA